MAEREMRVVLVEAQRDFDDLVSAQWGAERCTIDTEFESQTTYFERLSLLQVAWPELILVVDPFRVGDLGALATVFSSETEVVVHGAVNDVPILRRSVGRAPRRVFDTQIAAELAGYKRTALQFLAEELAGVEIDKTEQRRDWTARPLTESAVAYAAHDVAHLFDIADELLIDLQGLERVEAFRQDVDYTLANLRDRDPGEAWWRLTGQETLSPEARPYAQALAATREELARQLDVRPRHLIRDGWIIAAALAMPGGMRGLKDRLGHTRVASEFFDEFITAVAAVRDGAPTNLRAPRALDTTRDPEPLLAALKEVVRLRAEAMGISATLLASHKDLLHYVGGDGGRLGLPWRRTLLAPELDPLIAEWWRTPEPAPTP